MEPADGQGFELLAASLRADSADLPAFLEVLAGKLADALPGLVTVKRSGGLFAKRKPIASIEVSLDDRRYTATVRGLVVDTFVAHEVRGVRLSGDSVPLQTWLTEMGNGLDAYARRSAAGSAALRRLLG
ncbi:MAG: hypothetical protein QOJ11_2184 [Frankiales bacterium]|jgi:hypothetical protein|nr:hypothetical protein [Frankiales bacterium]